MKKKVNLILSIVFTTMLLVNCGQDTGKDTKTGILNLKFNDWVPDGIPATLLWKDVAAKIADNTKDRIKITNYLAGTLLKFPETFKGVSTGVADISNYVLGSAPGIHELTEIFDLPFLGFKDYDQAFRIYNEIINEFPEIQEENEKKGVRILSIRPFDPYWIHSVKKPVKLPADMKAQKAIATGYSSFLASVNGGVSMQTGPIDWYSGLQKGVVQHIITNWAPFGQFKLYEVAKIHTKF
jgi:TRAP-type C4-dicarboxylate transport system substrate-binding protein